MEFGNIVGILYIFVIGILLSLLSRFIGSKVFRFSEIIKYIKKLFRSSSSH